MDRGAADLDRDGPADDPARAVDLADPAADLHAPAHAGVGPVHASAASRWCWRGSSRPRPSEISMGLVQLGADEQANGVDQLRADLNAPMGVAADLDVAEPEGLNKTTRGAPAGYSLDPAYPRAQVTDRDPPYNAGAAIDAPSVYSEFVAPWRYPDHNMAGMRVGWEAPRTHVGPYRQGDDVTGPDGRDAGLRRGPPPVRVGDDARRDRGRLRRAARDRRREPRRPAGLRGVPHGLAHGVLAERDRRTRHGDWQRPLPDFNLDSDRGYAYQCWDYTRHASSVPAGRVHLPADLAGRTSGGAPRRSRRSCRSSPARTETSWRDDPGPVRVQRAAQRPAALRGRRQPAPPVPLRPAQAARPPLPARGPGCSARRPTAGTAPTSR